MLLRHSLGLEREAGAVETAVESALASGMRTADIARRGQVAVGCEAAADAIIERILTAQ